GADRGPQPNRTWSEVYEAGKGSEPDVPVEWSADVHAAPGRLVHRVDPSPPAVARTGGLPRTHAVHRRRSGRAAGLAAATARSPGAGRQFPQRARSAPRLLGDG